jgi:hypothetical protein
MPRIDDRLRGQHWIIWHDASKLLKYALASEMSAITNRALPASKKWFHRLSGCPTARLLEVEDNRHVAFVKIVSARYAPRCRRSRYIRFPP